jgi:Ala-tRNA(Pro) deacylase
MADETPRLADGLAPATPEDLFQRLQSLGIATTTTNHPPVFTVEEAKLHRGNIPGIHTKNLFLRNKKERMWLVVCHQDRTVDLKQLGPALGSRSRLSFGSPQRLMRYLGVIPGAVNPFAVINDHGQAVQLVVDRAILGDEPLNFHPLDNARTTSITTEDFLRFLTAEDHPPTLIDLAT